MHSRGDHLGANIKPLLITSVLLIVTPLAVDVVLYICLMIVNGINHVCQAIIASSSSSELELKTA